MTKVFTTPEQVLAAAGTPLGTSDWYPIEQERVDLFARATDDHQWIHVDRERAEQGPFGGTIAHGYLTLALVPRLTQDVFRVGNVALALNYGLDRVRFLCPVPVGARIRAEVRMDAVEAVSPETVRMRLETVVRIEDEERPACVCQGIGLVTFAAADG